MISRMEWNMGQYIRKIAYLFHYKNGSKGESVGYIKVSVRNGKGNLNVQLRIAKEYIESLRVCSLSESGQAEELGIINKKEGVFEENYLYEGNSLDTLLTLSGLFLPDGEEYYGARLDGKDLTEQMVKGAWSAHVQAFAEEFAKASSETASVVETELQFPFLEELYATEFSKTTQKESEEIVQTEPIAQQEEGRESVEQKEIHIKLEENDLENEQRLAWDWLWELEKKRRMKQEEEALQENPQGIENNIKEKEVELQKELESFEPKISQWTEQNMEQKKEEWTTEQQYETLLKQFPVYRPMEGASFLHSVRIEPKDIVLFPKEARMLAENSFLLHSFYQYKHLLLAKKQIEKQTEYWLMVPGLFRYRDLHLANTFGFTSFLPIREECRRRQKKQGEFGYWYLKLA